MTSLHKIYIQSRLPWIHRQYNGFKSWLQAVLTVISTVKYSVKDVNTVENTVVNTGTPRAIDGSHGFWPSPPLRNRKRGNYPDYFRFWAERAIIAIISDHCWANGNFFIGQQSTTGWQQIVNAVNRVCGRESGLTARFTWEMVFRHSNTHTHSNTHNDWSNALCQNNMYDNKIGSKLPKDLQGVDISDKETWSVFE